MKRLRRSDSSMMVASRSALASSSSDLERSRSAPAAPSTAASGVLRSCEIEVSSAERRRSVSIAALDAVDVLDEMDALDRQRALVDQRIQQPPLLGRSSGPGSSLPMPRMPIGAAAGAHRQEQPLGAGQGVGVAAGGAVLLPGPLGGGQVGLVERVLRRIAGLDGDRAVLGQQQDDAHLQHRGDLVGRGPEHVVERAGAGQLAAEGVERLRSCARAPWRRWPVRAPAGGEIGDDDGDQREEDERRDVGRVGDGEGVDRRQEEEVVAERGGDAGRTATATARSGRRRRRWPSGTRDRRSRCRSTGRIARRRRAPPRPPAAATT